MSTTVASVQRERCVADDLATEMSAQFGLRVDVVHHAGWYRLDVRTTDAAVLDQIATWLIQRGDSTGRVHRVVATRSWLG